MRSKKFILGLAVLGLVVASCGGSDKGSDATATNDTSAADSGDRDRNVEASSGWGDNGSGMTQVSLRAASSVRSKPRLFLRTDGEGSTQKTAIFATATVRTDTEGAKTAALVINGFQRNAATKTLDPLSGFGTDGSVKLELTDLSRGFDGVPDAWTILSRQYAALLFHTDASDENFSGYVEFYDLTTGRVATSLGTQGRVALDGAALGMSWIYDIAYRGKNAAGIDQVAVYGGMWDSTESDTMKIYGFGSDGKPDPSMGGDKGIVDLAGVIPDEWRTQNGPAWLADPGVDPANVGKVGLVGTIMFGGPESEMNEPGIVSIIVKPATGSQPTTTVKMNVVSAMQLILQNATIDGDTVRAMTRASWDGDGFQNVEVRVSSTEQWATDMTPGSNFVADDSQTQSAQGDWTAAVTPSGEWYGVDIVEDGPTWAETIQVCFVRDDCSNSANKVGRKLVDLPDNYSDNTWATSMHVDATGLQVVVRNDGKLGQQSRYSMTSLDNTGAASAAQTKQLDKRFGSNDKAAAAPTARSLPVAVGPNAVVGTKAVYGQDSSTSFESQVAGNDVVTTPIGMSSKVRGFFAAWDGPAMFDRSHALLESYLTDPIRGQVAYTKVDTSTGVLDPSFGIKMVPVDTFVQEMECTEDRHGAAGPNVFIATVYFGISDCGEIANISWFIMSPDGRVVTSNGKRISITPEFADRERMTGLASDAVGNLYVASVGRKQADVTYPSIDEAGNSVMETSTESIRYARVRRYTPTGALDTTFGKNGAVDLDRTTSDLFEYVGDVQLAVDAAGHVYVAGVPYDDSTRLTVARLTSTGALDVRIVKAPVATTTTVPSILDRVSPILNKPAAERASNLLSGRISEAVGGIGGGVAPPSGAGSSGETGRSTAGTVPSFFVGSVVHVGPFENGLTVGWAAVKGVEVVATALPGGRSCTSADGKCDIVGLDPSQSYSIVFSKKGEPVPDVSDALVTAAKPIVTLKLGKSATTKSLLKLTSKGKPTWKVTGGCVLNAAKSKVTAPKAPTTCQLSVTTAKDGKTPKTTKSVTISVTK